MCKEYPSRKRSPSDLTDEPWTLVEPRLPPAQPRQRGGRPHQVDRRDVLTTMRSLPRSGGPWERLPHALLPKRPADDSCAPWRDDGPWGTVGTAVRAQTRVAAGRARTPRAVGSASQAVQPTARGGPERGEDGGKSGKGRQRPLLVATRGRRSAVLLTGAGLDEGSAAPP
jgi:transposase